MSDHTDRDLERRLSETDLSHRSRVRESLRRDLLNKLENKSVPNKRSSLVMTVFSISMLAVLVIIFAVLVLIPDNERTSGKPGHKKTPTPEATITPTPLPFLPNLVNDAGDFCFAYPVGYTQAPVNTPLTITGPQANPGAQAGILWLDFSDAQGRTAEDAAAADLSGMPDLNPARSTVMLGGEEALVLDGMPGQDPVRKVYIVHNGMLYILTFYPQQSSDNAAVAQMEDLYQTVTNSWVWISSGQPCPEGNSAIPGELLPTPTPLNVNQVRDDYADFCFSYPDGFTPQPIAGLVVVNGPSLGGNSEVDYASVTVDFKDAQGQTTQSAADEAVAAYPDVAVERLPVLLGAEEAALLNGMPGSPMTRQIIIVHNDLLYTLTFSPYNSGFPEADDQMSQLYESVVSTWVWISSGQPCMGGSYPATSPSGGQVENMPPTPTQIVLSDDEIAQYAEMIRNYVGIPDLTVQYSGQTGSPYSPNLDSTIVFLDDIGGQYMIDVATGNMLQFGFNAPYTPGESKSGDELVKKACDYMSLNTAGFEDYADDLRLQVMSKGSGTTAFRWELPLPYAWQGTTAMAPFAQLVLYDDGSYASYTNTLFYLLHDGLDYPAPEPGDNGCD